MTIKHTKEKDILFIPFNDEVEIKNKEMYNVKKRKGYEPT